MDTSLHRCIIAIGTSGAWTFGLDRHLDDAEARNALTRMRINLAGSHTALVEEGVIREGMAMNRTLED